MPRPEITGYKAISELSFGGQGVVWRAIQLGPDRQVALKVLPPRTFDSKAKLARFEQEIRVSAQLEHHHIARLYEGGERDGVLFCSMELVKGAALDDYVREQQCSRERVLQLMAQICRAVHYAHQKGVLHTDLKPDNILVAHDGQPRLIDFGLAKALWSEGTPLHLSGVGVVAGTTGYMSPEQLLGDRARLDARSDVYSLGVILYQLLVHDFPHAQYGDRDAIHQRVLHEEPRQPRQLNPALDARLEPILWKAVQYDRTLRYPTALALAEDIEKYLRGGIPDAEPLGRSKTNHTPEKPAEEGRPLRRGQSGCGAVSLAAAGFAGLTWALLWGVQVTGALASAGWSPATNALVVHGLQAAICLLVITGPGLGVAGLCQRKRKRATAIAGLVLNVALAVTLWLFGVPQALLFRLR